MPKETAAASGAEADSLTGDKPRETPRNERTENEYLTAQIEKMRERERKLLHTNSELTDQMRMLEAKLLDANKANVLTPFGNGESIPSVKETALAILTGILASGWQPTAEKEPDAQHRRPEQVGKIASIDTMRKHVAGMAERFVEHFEKRWGTQDQKTAVPQKGAPLVNESVAVVE